MCFEAKGSASVTRRLAWLIVVGSRLVRYVSYSCSFSPSFEKTITNCARWTPKIERPTFIWECTVHVQQCPSNLQQLGSNVVMYAVDFEGSIFYNVPA
jgi:hypothetical protein